MSSLQSLDIAKRSATTTPTPQVRTAVPEVAKLIDVSSCIGCKACQVACMQWNDLRPEVGHNVGVYDNPADLAPEAWTVMRFSEVEVEQGKLEWLIRKDGCMHCEDPGCLKACPAPGAIVKYANGIVDFISENCIGCGYCVKGCPFDVPRISTKDNKAYKCSLCSDRVGVGLEPACVKTCPTGALQYGDRAELIAAAKKDGYGTIYGENDLGGLGSVYAFKDEPKLYGMKENPQIPASVVFWHTYLKPLSAIGLGGVVAAAAIHYLAIGPHKDDKEV